MNTTIVLKVLLAWFVHSCVTAIVVQKPQAPHLTRIYEAGIDILMTCYGDLHNGVGIAGDSDGSVLRALRSKYLMPVVLTADDISVIKIDKLSMARPLEAIVIATDSQKKFATLLVYLKFTIWWSRLAKFLILDTTPHADGQCSNARSYVRMASILWGLLDAQCVCFYRNGRTIVWSVNPFTPYAPQSWELVYTMRHDYRPLYYVFVRIYRKRGRNCEGLIFSKTRDLGGYPIDFFVSRVIQMMLNDNFFERFVHHPDINEFDKNVAHDERNKFKWFIDNIVRALNATAKITTSVNARNLIIYTRPFLFSDQEIDDTTLDYNSKIFTQLEGPLYAITQHTPHKSQLEKILTVIDRPSRIGMLLVYLVTFLFFKFCLRQPIVPAILNIMRLTCNTGLTELPKNLAPTIYLACLFMFVVTLQGIYTGNLASLLTTTIAYRNVNTKQDIANLGYTAYTSVGYNKLAADPNLDGHVVKISDDESLNNMCYTYVTSDPLAACITSPLSAVLAANSSNLHISKDYIITDYLCYIIDQGNPLGRRLKEIMVLWVEHGLRNHNDRIEKMRLQFVDDSEVKKNTVRRVMVLDDLLFAFVILTVGLVCSLLCFISELVIFRVRLKLAKRRGRARALLAWQPTEKNWFSSLNFRFNPRRLFSKRR